MAMATEFAVMEETLVTKTSTELMLVRSTVIPLMTKVLKVDFVKTPRKKSQKIQTMKVQMRHTLIQEIGFSSFSYSLLLLLWIQE